MAKGSSDHQSDTEAGHCNKPGPLLNELQKAATQLHTNFLHELDTLATKYQVDVCCIWQYLALEVSLHHKPNLYNVFLHARVKDDPKKEDGMCFAMWWLLSADAKLQKTRMTGKLVNGKSTRIFWMRLKREDSLILKLDNCCLETTSNNMSRIGLMHWKI